MRFNSCAFGPHHALFHLSERSQADVRLQQCSVFLVDGAAFWIEERGGFSSLRVENSIFSRPVDEPPPAGTLAALFKCVGHMSPDLHYLGNGNAYHNLGAYFVRGDEKLTWTQFLQRHRDVRDEHSRLVTRWPWSKGKPLEDLDDNQPQQAFALEVDHPDVRHGAEIIGIQAFAGPLYRPPLPPPDDRSVNVRIVDPAQEPEGNRHKSLIEAIAAARAGDTILIQHDGLLPIDLIGEKNALDLTVKAAEGFHPVLTLKGAARRMRCSFVYVTANFVSRNSSFCSPRQAASERRRPWSGSWAWGGARLRLWITLDNGEAEAAFAVVAPRRSQQGHDLGRRTRPCAPCPSRLHELLCSAAAAIVPKCLPAGRLTSRPQRCFCARRHLSSASPPILMTRRRTLQSRLALEHVTTYLAGNLVHYANNEKATLVPCAWRPPPIACLRRPVHSR